VRGIVIESPQCDGELLFADGTVVDGQIKSVHKVGMGFRHEAASVEIEFERIFPGNAAPIEMRARVLEVDNAREKVKGGVIHGIRGTNTPQDRLSRRLQYLAMLYPDDALWILPAYRALVPIFPEPEIYFPRGTDLLLELTAPLEVTGEINLAPANQEFDGLDAYSLDEMMDTVPERSATPKGRDADFVNLAFIGSQDQVRKAFDAAGWMTADAMRRRTALREIHAFLIVGNYAHGPMSKQLLNGKAADSTWEKGLDSLAKRDHLRIWSTPDTLEGQSIWLSAATREIGASLSLRRREFVHHVDPNIDSEREMVVRDLTLAGCVDKVHVDRRLRMPHAVVNATGDDLYTDAAIAFVKLKDCENPVFQNISDAPKIASRPPTKFARYLRTQVLSARDIWRENVVYGAYDASRMAIGAIRRRRANGYNTGKQNVAQPVTTSLTSGLASTSADD
jgi:LssY C-terminus